MNPLWETHPAGQSVCPDVLIKVPGTEQVVPVIEELIADGVNVNVTLLFSTRRYELVALAYIAGLERRLQAGRPVDRVAFGGVVLRLPCGHGGGSHVAGGLG